MDRKHIDEKKQRIIEERKQMLQTFVDNGGVLEDLNLHNPEYKAMKNLDIYVDGRRLTLEERFAYLGFPRKPQQKPFDGKVQEIKEILDNFVEQGGDVDEIDTAHPLYAKMRAFTPVVNGKKLSMEEKFELAGHPRHPKYNDMNVVLERLSALKDYQDENGCVDSYRQNESLKQYLSYCANMFGFPPSLIVCLLADQKLKSYVVYTDRTEFLKTALTEYLKVHKDFVGIKRADPQLYCLLTSVSKSYPTESGRKLTNLELVEALGFEGVPNAFIKENLSSVFSEKQFIARYSPIAQAKGGVIALSDIDSADASALMFHLRRINQTKSEFFARYNIKFLHPRINDRNKKINLPEYPYLEEMRAKVTQTLNDFYTLYPEFEQASAGDAFALKAEVIRSVYEEYKYRIESKYILGTPDPSAKEKQ